MSYQGLSRIEEEESKQQIKHSIAERDVAPGLENWFSTQE